MQKEKTEQRVTGGRVRKQPLEWQEGEQRKQNTNMEQRMNNIKHKILVLSGKGGVGKSTVATQLARCLVNSGCKVGLLDVDLCGPSIPRLVGLQGRDVKKCSEGYAICKAVWHVCTAVVF
jgi:Mrp family chromosome partitioning ATPase